MVISCGAFLSINSQTVDIKIFPNDLGLTIAVLTLPVYIVMIGFTVLGLVLGTVFEYFRARRHRIGYKKSLREVEKLNAHVKYLTKEKTSETEQILGLLSK